MLITAILITSLMSSYYSHFIWSQGLPHWVPATRDPFFKLLHIVQQTSEIRTTFDFRSKPTADLVHQIDLAVPKWEPYLVRNPFSPRHQH